MLSVTFPVFFIKLYDLFVVGVSDRVEEPAGRSAVFLAGSWCSGFGRSLVWC